MVNPVSAPHHYVNTGVEPIDAIDAWLPYWPWPLGFCLANTVKYIARCSFKNKLRQDLEKALWYLERGKTRLRDEVYVAPKANHMPDLQGETAVAAWKPSWSVTIAHDLERAILLLSGVVDASVLSEVASHIKLALDQLEDPECTDSPKEMHKDGEGEGMSATLYAVNSEGVPSYIVELSNGQLLSACDLKVVS